MATIRKYTAKSGRDYYEFRCKFSRDEHERSTRWYVPDGWSAKAIEREVTKQAAEFERRCRAGEVLTRSEQREKEAAAKQAAASILTVRQYGERVFMPVKSVTCSENTRASFHRMLKLYIYPVIGALKMPDVSSADINALLLDFQSNGRAHSTCVKLYTILNLLFKMAYMDDFIPRNPMDKVQRPKARKEEYNASADVESFTVDEVRHILACLENEPLKWRVYIRLMADTGIRRGEACALTWQNVDFEAETITISQSLNYTKEAGVFVGTPKSGKTRTVNVDSYVMQLLRQLRQEQANTAISPYIFTQNGTAAPMHPQSPTRYMQKFGERYGVKHMHPHKLRHTFASIAITNGADVSSVSEILGHADSAVTLRVYAHADEKSRKKASNIFRSAIKDNKQA